MNYVQAAKRRAAEYVATIGEALPASWAKRLAGAAFEVGYRQCATDIKAIAKAQTLRQPDAYKIDMSRVPGVPGCSHHRRTLDLTKAMERGADPVEASFSLYSSPHEFGAEAWRCETADGVPLRLLVVPSDGGRRLAVYIKARRAVLEGSGLVYLISGKADAVQDQQHPAEFAEQAAMWQDRKA